RFDQRHAFLQLGHVRIVQFFLDNGFWRFLCIMVVFMKERSAFIRCGGWGSWRCGFALTGSSRATGGATRRAHVGKCEKRFLNSRLSAPLMIAHCRIRPYL